MTQRDRSYDRAAAALVNVLDDSETILVAVRAQPPVAFSRTSQYLGLIYYVIGRVQLNRGAKRLRAEGLPASPRMVLVSTQDRLLVLQARRRWNPLQFRGAISKAEFDSVTVADPWATSWKEARFHKPSGWQVTVGVERSRANQFVATFR